MQSNEECGSFEEERARFQGIMAAEKAPECQCSVVLVRSRRVCNLGGEEEDGSMAMVSGERRERERRRAECTAGGYGVSRSSRSCGNAINKTSI